MDSENSRSEEKNLLRKIDLRVLPMLSLLFALSLIDRTNIAAAKISGMQKDLELFGNRYSVALLAFFPTFIISEIPSNIIIRRVGTRYYLAFLILCWGVVSMCHAFVKTFGQLVTLRVLLGLFEGGFTPACIYIISSWYKRYETQQRISVWFMTGSVIAGFNGVISYGLSTLEGFGSLRGWRWIFLIPGAITVVMAIPIFFLVTDFPEKAKWLTKHELEMVLQRLEDDKGESAEDKLTFKKGVAALSDWKVWLVASSLFFITTSTYTMVFFTPSILKGLGFSVALSQILVTPPYIFATIVSIGTAIWADRSRKRSPFIIGSLILTISGFLMIGWGKNTATRLIGIFFAHTGTSCATPAALTFLTNNVVGQSKRQMAIPVQTIYGGLGGIVGSLIFRDQDAPGYRPGISTAAAALGVCILTTAGITIYFRGQNKKADEQGKIIEGVEGFRYTL